MSNTSSISYPQVNLFIAGTWRPGTSDRRCNVSNPSSGMVLAQYAAASPQDVEEAGLAAHYAFADWAAKSAMERNTVLMRAADVIEARVSDIGQVMVAESGKPIVEAEEELRVSAQIFRWCAEEGKRTYGRIVPGRDSRTLGMVLLEPYGPVAAFTPWNFPALTPARKIAGALAAGCTLVLKPAEETPGTAMALIQACVDAGLPSGVLNLVLGDPPSISDQLIRMPQVRKVSLTGSVLAGRSVGRLAGEMLKPATLELGGHAPFIVWHDADIASAVGWAMRTKFRNAGQVCVASSRFFVHERVVDEFVERLVVAVRVLKVGDPMDASTQMGPMASERGARRYVELVIDACQQGARLRTGGSRREGAGFFVEPCVLDNVPPAARVLREEPFGPIAPVVAVRSLDEVVIQANSLPLGLASYAFTHSEAVAQRLQRELRAGMLAINHGLVATPETPFGGVGDSGIGREGGLEGLQAFLETRYVSRGYLPTLQD